MNYANNLANVNDAYKVRHYQLIEYYIIGVELRLNFKPMRAFTDIE